MICEECKRRRFKKVLEEADEALDRYYNKLRRKNGKFTSKGK